jgi:hypothetical protein
VFELAVYKIIPMLFDAQRCVIAKFIGNNDHIILFIISIKALNEAVSMNSFLMNNSNPICYLGSNILSYLSTAYTIGCLKLSMKLALINGLSEFISAIAFGIFTGFLQNSKRNRLLLGASVTIYIGAYLSYYPPMSSSNFFLSAYSVVIQLIITEYENYLKRIPIWLSTYMLLPSRQSIW